MSANYTTYFPTTNANTHELWAVWTQPALYAVADFWLDGVADAGWDWDAGFSHINGVRYPTAVYFKHKEDYLVFKLKFNKLLKFK